MDNSLHLHDHLLTRGRQLLRVGRPADARALLNRLLRQPDVSPAATAAARLLLGEMEVAAGRYRRACRHFAAAAGLNPQSPEAFTRYAAVVEADPDADPARAVAAIRRAIRLDAHRPEYWTTLGRLVFRTGDERRALRAFRRAARLRPEGRTLSEVVDGFVLLGRQREARKVLMAARFAAPNDAGVSGLWNRFRFDCLRRDLARAVGGGDAGATILPFPRRVGRPAAADPTPVVIRADRRSRPAPHVLRLFGYPSDPRR